MANNKKIIHLCKNVANRLGRYTEERKQIFDFLKDRTHWHEHIKQFGVKATCDDLRFTYGFGGGETEKEQKEFTKFYLKMIK